MIACRCAVAVALYLLYQQVQLALLAGEPSQLNRDIAHSAIALQDSRSCC